MMAEVSLDDDVGKSDSGKQPHTGMSSCRWEESGSENPATRVERWVQSPTARARRREMGGLIKLR